MKPVHTIVSLNEVPMPKILNVLTDTNIGGAGTYIATYVKNCDFENFSVSVLLPKNSAVKNLLENTDCEIIEADIAPDKSLDVKSIPVIRSIIKKGKYDLVHAHGSASARIAAKGLCKCVFTKHTLSEGSGLVSKLMYGAMGGYAVAVSKSSADNLVNLGFNKKRIFTVFNGVDDMQVPDSEEKARAKAYFGIDPDKFVIGCVARFHTVKNHKTLIDAAKITLQENKNIVFLFVGDGELKDAMMLYAKEQGIDSNCVFAGVVYDRERVYHAMDLYTLCSHHETFGLSMVESWSSGITSVVSSAEGLAEISENDVNSIVCDTNDSNAFASAYLKLSQDDNLRKNLSDNALLEYKNKFCAKIFAQNLEKVYQIICE